jgi:hypothetical protein
MIKPDTLKLQNTSDELKNDALFFGEHGRCIYQLNPPERSITKA